MKPQAPRAVSVKAVGPNWIALEVCACVGKRPTNRPTDRPIVGDLDQASAPIVGGVTDLSVGLYVRRNHMTT